MRAMKLSHLRNFIVVAECGSVQGAGRRLGLTQPAITRSLRALEQELGAALFERSGSGMALTAIGRTVLRRAGGVQAEIGRIKDEVAQLTGRGSGAVSVGLSFVAHAGLLPKVISAFRRTAPDVRLEIKESLFAAVEADLQNGVIDFYVGPIRPGQSYEGKLTIEPLFENRRQIYCRRDHPLSAARSLAELSGASWVTASSTRNSPDELAALFSHYGLPPPHIAVNVQTMLSMMAIAGSSDLLTALPQQLQELLGLTSHLVRIPVCEQLLSATICIVKRVSTPLTPAAEMLSDLFRRAAITHAASLPDTEALAR
jgi:LysR family transcriptional regulator, regulator of abg operon